MKRFNRTTPLFSALVALLLSGCDAEFDPGSTVSSLRVLAVQVDRPFAQPGQTVRLQALSHDPLDRPLTWAWALCQNPASSSVEACIADILANADSGTSPLLASGPGQDNVELTIPADALERLAPEARPQALMGVLSVACPGTLSLGAEVSAASTGLPIRCTDENGAELGLHDYIVGVKRIFLRESEENQNPEIERILFDGQDWPADEVKEVGACDTDEFDFDACDAGDPHRIAAIVSEASFQSGRDEFNRDFSEQVIVQHYATEGIFEDEVRIAADSDNGWVARQSASGNELRLWFVARDDRGGVSWAERRVRVR